MDERKIATKIAKSLLSEEGGRDEYTKFFRKMLDKYNISSITELSDEDKKKFFNEIDAGWEGDDEKK